MGQTLTHGVYLPDEGERNCYSGLAANWQILDNSVGTVAEHTSALAGKAPLVHTHTKSDITDFPVYGNTAGTICEGNDSRLSDARTPVAHTHTKSDVTDLFNSDNTWSAGQTFSAKILTKTANTEIVGEDVYQCLKSNGSRAISFRISNNSNYRTLLLGVHDTNNSPPKGLVISNDNSNNISVYSDSPQYLGTSSNQWQAVYAQSYYYNGTAWGLDKVNEWSNTNYFNKTLFCDFSNLANKAIPDAYIQAPLIIVEGNTSPKTWHGGIALERYTNGDEGFQLLTCSYVNGTTQQLGALRYLVSGDGTESYCYSRGPIKQHLGTSTNKWTTLNGINPGALSLPNLASDGYIDLSDNISANTEYSYTPTVDGWLALYCLTTGFHAENAVGIFNADSTLGNDSFRWAASATAAINLSRQTGQYYGSVILPVKAGYRYYCWLRVDQSTTLGLKKFIFYKAQGNV